MNGQMDFERVLEAPGQDEWLRRQVSECLDTEYDDLRFLFQVEAAGMIHRWRELPREDGRRLVQALLTGDRATIDEIDLPRAWIRSLTIEQQREIEGTMLAACDRLEQELRDIPEYDLGSDHYDAAMNRLVLGRERLECVASILHQCERLTRALERIDEEGWVQIRALPDFEMAADTVEVLERAALVDHESWWVRPVTRREG